jgi:hypothetical protein
MNAQLDYQDIAARLLAASSDVRRLHFHFLDLAELQRLSVLSRGNSRRFSRILLDRSNVLKRTGNALIVRA